MTKPQHLQSGLPPTLFSCYPLSQISQAQPHEPPYPTFTGHLEQDSASPVHLFLLLPNTSSAKESTWISYVTAHRINVAKILLLLAATTLFITYPTTLRLHHTHLRIRHSKDIPNKLQHPCSPASFQYCSPLYSSLYQTLNGNLKQA